MITLSERLKSLGVKIGAADLAPKQPRIAYPIESVLEGRVVETMNGSAFAVETTYGLDYRHGTTALAPKLRIETIAEWTRDARVQQADSQKFVFIDTETTGLVGGTGTYPFLIGVGRFAGDEFRLTQLFMRDPAEEPAVLAALSELLAPCDALVTFNGKSFDVPLIATRYIVHRIESQIRSSPHIDLLPLARRLWRDRLESRALGSLEQHILQAQRTHEDVHGSLIPAIYFDYLRTQDARPLAGVFYHNAMDVVAMAALLTHVSGMLNDPLGFETEHGADLVGMGKLLQDLGRLSEAAAVFGRALELDLSEELFRETAQRLAYLERRQGRHQAALDLWMQAASRKEVYAIVELAKYYEHRARDIPEAMRWTLAARELVQERDSSPATRREWLAPLEHRMNRLEGKLHKTGGRAQGQDQ